MYHVGVDLGDKCSSIAILNDDGKVFKQMEVKGNWGAMLGRVAMLPRPMAICYEASCGYGYLHEKFSKLSDRVMVAHPGQLRLIFRSKKKHNRVDALKLAKLLYLDEVPRVHVPSVEVRSWRMMIEFRQKLLARRVSAKNQIRTLLKSQGIAVGEASGVKSLWTKRGTAWLQAQELPQLEALRREMIVDELKDLNEKIKRVESVLANVAANHPGVALLMTIPGVGIRTAETFVAYVDDIGRFTRLKEVGSYFGLVPCQDATGNVNRLGHITRDGPATMRKLLIEAAWQGVRRSSSIRAFFERIKRNDPDRGKIALVATGHWLVRVMSAMLRSGECWRETVAPAAGAITEEDVRQSGRRLKDSPPEDTAARKPVSSGMALGLEGK
jgi:transposase